MVPLALVLFRRFIQNGEKTTRLAVCVCARASARVCVCVCVRARPRARACACAYVHVDITLSFLRVLTSYLTNNLIPTPRMFSYALRPAHTFRVSAITLKLHKRHFRLSGQTNSPLLFRSRRLIMPRFHCRSSEYR